MNRRSYYSSVFVVFTTLVIAVSVVIGGGILLAACQPAGTTPESDSAYEYAVGATIPTDPNIYTISGYVYADVDSMVRQTAAAESYVTANKYGATGVYHGAEYDGKTFVRLFVEKSDSPIAPVESVVIIKATDTKASALLPKDRVTFKCRHQFEAIAAIFSGEGFDPQSSLTQELDYCRLVTPIIDVP